MSEVTLNFRISLRFSALASQSSRTALHDLLRRLHTQVCSVERSSPTLRQLLTNVMRRLEQADTAENRAELERTIEGLLSELGRFKAEILPTLNRFRRTVINGLIEAVENLLAGQVVQTTRQKPNSQNVSPIRPEALESQNRGLLLNQNRAELRLEIRRANEARSRNQIERTREAEPREHRPQPHIDLIKSTLETLLTPERAQDKANAKVAAERAREVLDTLEKNFQEFRLEQAENSAKRQRENGLESVKSLSELFAELDQQADKAAAARQALTLVGKVSSEEIVAVLKELLDKLPQETFAALAKAIKETPADQLPKIMSLLEQVFPEAKLGNLIAENLGQIDKQPKAPAVETSEPANATNKETPPLPTEKAIQLAQVIQFPTQHPIEPPSHQATQPLGNQPTNAQVINIAEYRAKADQLKQAVPDAKPANTTAKAANTDNYQAVNQPVQAAPAQLPSNPATQSPMASTEAARNQMQTKPAVTAEAVMNRILQMALTKQQLIQLFCSGTAKGVKALSNTEITQPQIIATAKSLLSSPTTAIGQIAVQVTNANNSNPAIRAVHDLIRAESVEQPIVAREAATKLLKVVAHIANVHDLLNIKQKAKATKIVGDIPVEVNNEPVKASPTQNIVEVKKALRELAKAIREEDIKMPEKAIDKIVVGLRQAGLITDQTMATIRTELPKQSGAASMIEMIVKVLERQTIAEAIKTAGSSKTAKAAENTPAWLSEQESPTSILSLLNATSKEMFVLIVQQRLGFDPSMERMPENTRGTVEALQNTGVINEIYKEVLKALEHTEIESYSQAISFLSDVVDMAKVSAQGGEYTSAIIDLALKTIVDRVRREKAMSKREAPPVSSEAPANTDSYAVAA